MAVVSGLKHKGPSNLEAPSKKILPTDIKTNNRIQVLQESIKSFENPLLMKGEDNLAEGCNPLDSLTLLLMIYPLQLDFMIQKNIFRKLMTSLF